MPQFKLFGYIVSQTEDKCCCLHLTIMGCLQFPCITIQNCVSVGQFFESNCIDSLVHGSKLQMVMQWDLPALQKKAVQVQNTAKC